MRERAAKRAATGAALLRAAAARAGFRAADNRQDPPGKDAPGEGEPSGDAAAKDSRADREGEAPAGPIPPAGRRTGTGAPAADAVPRWLRVSAAWSWRLLVLAALLYVAGKVAGLLRRPQM